MADDKKLPVRDPLLPLTHYQRLSKKQPKTRKRFYAFWVFILFVAALVGTGTLYLHNEIEALHKVPHITPLPTEAQQQSIVTPVEATPQASKPASFGEICGGIAGKQCDDGLVCRMDGKYPDASGHCVADTKTPQPNASSSTQLQATPQPTAAPNEGGATMCTMDAMHCPDGSWVGRTGPKCEFKCPAPQ